MLSRAVRWHLENRILVYQNKTVVFVEVDSPAQGHNRKADSSLRAE